MCACTQFHESQLHRELFSFRPPSPSTQIHQTCSREFTFTCNSKLSKHPFMDLWITLEERTSATELLEGLISAHNIAFTPASSDKKLDALGPLSNLQNDFKIKIMIKRV